MINMKKSAALLLAALMCLSAASCGKDDPKENTPETKIVETSASPETSSPETDPTETTPIDTELDETEKETVPPLPDDAELIVDPDEETTAPSGPSLETTAPETEKSEETTAETEAPAETEEPRIYDYLNGKTVTKEEQQKRPVAIMLNNIKKCLPQNSLLAGQIYYEFPVEGGITRIMMLVNDYENLAEVGSIRSSRDYFVDMLHTHNALYIHAGGSPMAYDKLFARNINYMDAVTTYIPDMYYRDQYRLYNMGLEHSLMTTGEKIVNGIKYMKYETEHDDSFTPSFKFYDETVDHQPVGAIASHVHMNSTFLQTVDFVYNKDTGEYLRYQYGGMPHVDGLTGEQLSVKNVIILFTNVALIPGDEAGRLSIDTVGSGQGYYITNGRRKVISWSREHDTAPLKLTFKDGEDLILNSGKTYICVVDKSVAKGIVFDYQW